ncbi:MAG: hypothetical protein HOC24_10950 [Deltaproteobacteria bacterium]|jgi:hypothetical protein|nr:hypothetical protein [Deltaproteobacteria bacterium]
MRKAVFTAPVTIYLSQDIYKQVKAVTDKKNISMAEYLRKAAEQFLLKESDSCKTSNLSTL